MIDRALSKSLCDPLLELGRLGASPGRREGNKLSTGSAGNQILLPVVCMTGNEPVCYVPVSRFQVLAYVPHMWNLNIWHKGTAALTCRIPLGSVSIPCAALNLLILEQLNSRYGGCNKEKKWSWSIHSILSFEWLFSCSTCPKHTQCDAQKSLTNHYGMVQHIKANTTAGKHITMTYMQQRKYVKNNQKQANTSPPL